MQFAEHFPQLHSDANGQTGFQTGEFAGADVKAQTHMVFRNMAAVLKEAGCGLNDVVKSTVLLADMADFAAVNEIYAQNFSQPFPARSTFAVKTLPKNAYALACGFQRSPCTHSAYLLTLDFFCLDSPSSSLVEIEAIAVVSK